MAHGQVLHILIILKFRTRKILVTLKELDSPPCEPYCAESTISSLQYL